ncbi:MAG: homocysteine S-methyltransferase family protein [Ignavibacteriaceae bacterium]|nr:homocysteine S-methyltransferase family protein [Ignavibacteriaceae bacterium]
MKSIVKALQDGKILISDGAWGTYLHKLGLGIGECPEIWNITHRSEVLSIARSYIEAGSDMILTNSFGAHPIRLEHYGLQDRAFELNEAAAAISREAAGENHFVLGSIGPSSAIVMMGEIPEEKIFDGFRIQVEGLAHGGADAVCIETMSEIEEAVLAIRAAKEFSDLEVVATFTFQKTVHGYYRTMMGVSPEEMVNALKSAGADIIGANCGMGFEQMIDIVKVIRSVDSDTPVLIHANAGLPIVKNGETTFPETPEMMCSRIGELINAGVNIVGGCCGTTPDHIRAFAQLLKTKNSN